MSSSEHVMNLLPDFADDLDWQEVSKNEHFPAADIETLEEYADDLNWNIVCKRNDFVFTNDILEKFTDRIDWTMASNSDTINFSVFSLYQCRVDDRSCRIADITIAVRKIQRE